MNASGCLVAPDCEEWSSALREAPHDAYHLPAYVILEAERSGGTAAAFSYRENGSFVLLPLILRAIPGHGLRDAVSPYGYPGPFSNAMPSDVAFWERAVDALRRTLAGHDVVTAFLRLHPLVDLPLDALARSGEVVAHGDTVSVDLTLPLDEMWAATRKTHRHEINRARRSGIAITWDDWNRLDEWRGLYEENMRLVGAGEDYFFPASYFVALHETLGDATHLALAWLDDELLGGQLVFERGGIVQTHLSAMRTSSRRHHPDKLLYDEVRRWAKARGNTVHHLGGGYGGANDGLFAYKAGFSARRHTFRTWRVVVDQQAYHELTHSAGVHETAGEFFPAYRQSWPGRRAQ